MPRDKRQPPRRRWIVRLARGVRDDVDAAASGAGIACARSRIAASSAGGRSVLPLSNTNRTGGGSGTELVSGPEPRDGGWRRRLFARQAGSGAGGTTDGADGLDATAPADTPDGCWPAFAGTAGAPAALFGAAGRTGAPGLATPPAVPAAGAAAPVSLFDRVPAAGLTGTGGRGGAGVVRSAGGAGVSESSACISTDTWPWDGEVRDSRKIDRAAGARI